MEIGETAQLMQEMKQYCTCEERKKEGWSGGDDYANEGMMMKKLKRKMRTGWTIGVCERFGEWRRTDDGG